MAGITSPPGNPEAGTVLDGMGYKQILTACSGTSNTSLDLPGLPAGVYVGVIYPIDYFGNVLTNYYPCASTRNDYKMIVTTYLP